MSNVLLKTAGFIAMLATSSSLYSASLAVSPAQQMQIISTATDRSSLMLAVNSGTDRRLDPFSVSPFPDEVMWRLLEEPFKSDDQKFIDYLRAKNLMYRQDRDGDTVLSIAALNGQVAVIDYLAANGVDIDRTNNRGNTVFDHAIRLSDPVKAALLRHGADINHSLPNGRTPLMNAVLSEDINTVRFLIHHGADIDRNDYLHADALFYAATIGNLGIVKALVEAVNTPNLNSLSRALQTARNNHNIAVGDYLLTKGAIP